MIGINLQLFNGSTSQANLSNIQALWWDVAEPKEGSRPIGKTSVATTDANGYIDLDLSKVTGLAIGDYGFLMLYKKDGTNHEDSLVFAGKVQTSNITSGVDMYYYDSGWTRPADWLTLPTVSEADQKFVGLFGVFDHDSNFVALTATGNYTVDWGDGSATEDINSGVTAQHQYTYSTISDSTLCNRGYKQVIVTITPQTGQSLTQVNLQKRHSGASTRLLGVPWLDLAASVSASTALPVVAGQGGPVVILAFLEQCAIYNTELCTNFSSMFNSCYSLQSIPALNTAAGTDFSNMFYGCHSLQSIPALNTAAGTNFSSMFTSCFSLQSIPALNTAAGTNFYYMFNSCYSLQAIPALNTASGTNFSNMFTGCYSLQSIPALNTAAGTNFSSMFYGCYSLQSIPALNTAAGTNFSSMFTSCYSLQSIPALNTAAGTDFSSMFYNCLSLAKSQITGASLSHSYQNCNLSASALNAIYTNLPTVIGKTLTVTGNYGAASDNPSIATAKGWTVTG